MADWIGCDPADGRRLIWHPARGEHFGFLHRQSEVADCEDCTYEATLPESEKPRPLMGEVVAHMMRGLADATRGER